MPWKESSIVNERMKFVLRLVDGEKMSDLCREFGITRPTGYKIYKRFKESGPPGLYDCSKKPKKFGNAIDELTVHRLMMLKDKYKTWGAPKIQEKYRQKYDDPPPAISTIHSYFVKAGLVKKRRKRSGYKASGLNLTTPKLPNDLWCCDFKGQFKMKNKAYCYPLTITDQVSRSIFCIEALENTKTEPCLEVFKNVFKEYGLPDAIRSDNGVPFATKSLFGLSKLSIMWLKQGIKLERIEPGKPQQNGRHERMHLSLKLAATKPPGENILQQQEIFDYFRREFNEERPHEGLGMKVPSDVYRPSKKIFVEKKEVSYDNNIDVRKVNEGVIKLNTRSVFIGRALSDELIGLEEVDENILLVKFMDHDLGYIDTIEYKFSQGENPFLLKE